MNRDIIAQVTTGIALSICTVIVLLFSTKAAAQAGAKEMAAPRDVVVIATSNNFPPINMLAENGSLTGFAREVSTAVAKAQGLDVQYMHSAHWTQVVEWLQTGRARVIHDTGYNKERDQIMDFTSPILQMHEMIFVDKSRVDISSLQSLYGKEVACVDKHISHMYLAQFPQIRCHVVNTPAEGLAALVNHHVDAFVYPELIVQYLSQKLDWTARIKSVGEPLRELSWSMVVAEGDQQMLTLLNEGIAKIKASGEYDRIFQRWFGKSLFHGYTERQLKNMVAFAAALSLLLGLLISALFYMRRLKTVNKALEKSRGTYKTLLDNLPLKIYYRNKDLEYVSCNRLFAQSLGVSVESIEGGHDKSLACKDDHLQGNHELYDEDVLAGAGKKEFEQQIDEQSGTRFFKVQKVPVKSEVGNVVGVLGILQDITEERKLAHAIEESEQRFRQLAECLEDVFWLTSADMQNLYYVSPAFEQVWGMPCQRFRENSLLWTACIHTDDRAALLASVQRKIEGDWSSNQLPLYRTLRNGEYRWIKTQAYAVFNEDGGVDKIACRSQDVTDVINAEAALNKTNLILTAISKIHQLYFQAGDESVFLRNAAELMVNVCAYIKVWIGSLDQQNDITINARSQGLGPELYEAFADIENQNKTKEYMHHVLQMSEQQLIFPFKDERKVQETLSQVQILMLPLRIEDVAEYVICLCSYDEQGFSKEEVDQLQDMARYLSVAVSNIRIGFQRDHAKAQAVAMQSHLNNILSTLPDILYQIDLQTRPVTWNKELERATGYTSGEIAAMRAEDFFPREERKKIRQAIEQAYQTGSVEVETLLLCKDARELAYRFTASPLRDESGKICGLTGTGRDISEWQQASQEREQLLYQLQQAQKMESLGQLTGGVAHDFNNILTSVMGYTDLSLETLNDKNLEKTRSYLEQVKQAAVRARGLVAKMLAFSRKTGGEKSLSNLAAIVEESVSMIRPMLPSSIEIRLVSPEDAILMVADPVQIQQSVLNLCINARDAMGSTGSISIELIESQRFSGVCDSCHRSFDDKFISLIVTDTGSGIEPDVLERMFEPFVTTKSVGKGSGMGMSIVHGCVHDHGGHIKVLSHGKLGTEIRLLLPAQAVELAIPEKEQSMAYSAVEKSSLKSGAHVMVVDDEASVVQFMSEMLRLQGYKVSGFSSSEQAMEFYRQNSQNIDAVITDQTMPKFTGMEIATQMLEIRPDLPILLCTGYSEQVNENSAINAGIQRFLQKPIDMHLLLNSIAEVLEVQIH